MSTLKSTKVYFFILIPGFIVHYSSGHIIYIYIYIYIYKKSLIHQKVIRCFFNCMHFVHMDFYKINKSPLARCFWLLNQCYMTEKTEKRQWCSLWPKLQQKCTFNFSSAPRLIQLTMGGNTKMPKFDLYL